MAQYIGSKLKYPQLPTGCTLISVALKIYKNDIEINSYTGSYGDVILGVGVSGTISYPILDDVLHIGTLRFEWSVITSCGVQSLSKEVVLPACQYFPPAPPTPSFTCADLAGCSLDDMANGVLVASTNTIDMSGDGTTGSAIEADLIVNPNNGTVLITSDANGVIANVDVPNIISSDPNNTATIGLDGNIFVPASVVFDDQALTASNTNTINVTLTPSAPSGADNQVDYTMSADLKIDTVAPGNVALTTTANGLVANAVITPDFIQSVSDTQSINLNVIGNDLTADIIYQDTDTVALLVDANGLRADIKHQNSNSIELTEDINGLKADLQIDTITPGNVIITEGVNGVVANYTQLPVVTLCEIEGNGNAGNEIKLKNSFYKDGLFVTFFPTVTGGFIPSTTTPTKQFKELLIFKDGCQPGVFLDLPSADCDSVVYKSDVLDSSLQRVKPLENVEFYNLDAVATTPQLDKNYIHLIDTSAGAYSLVLPVPTDCDTNVVKVKKMSSDLNDITVTGATGELIDDLAAWNKSVLSPSTVWSQYECYVFTFNRLTNKWYVNS